MPIRCPLLVFLLLLLVAGRARAAEEVFVLDNGSVFRGHVVKQEPRVVRIRLSGFGRDGVVALDTRRIVNRFVPVAAPVRVERPQTAFEDWSANTLTPDQAALETASTAYEIPDVEPDIRDENFFQRMARVTVLALPESLGGRVSLAVLFLFVVGSLLRLGGRIVEIETMTPTIAALLGVFLGGALILNMLHYEDMLRADRAPWLLPLQGILWLGMASVMLRCGFERVFVLFAFVSFSLAVAVFGAGAILVAY